MLFSLTYKSRALIDFDRYELYALLAQARTKNASLNITGMLLYHNKHFIQTLEGEKETVLNIFESIVDDSRHVHVKKMTESEIEKRVYPNWSMGFKKIHPEEYRNIPALTLFMEEDNLSHLNNVADDLMINFKINSQTLL